MKYVDLIKNLIDGKKMYLTALAVFICGGVKALETQGIIAPIPMYLWEFVSMALVAFGITAYRSSQKKQE